MEANCQPCNPGGNLYGNLLVVGFLVVQCLDGVLTYVGMVTWGPTIEANPLVSSAVSLAGPGLGLTAAKLISAGCGIFLHLLHAHGIVAVLTAFYVAVAILPWTALFIVVSH